MFPLNSFAHSNEMVTLKRCTPQSWYSQLFIILFQAGADVTQPINSNGTTPLMMALARGAPNSVIQLLLQSGADPHVSDSGGLSVLYRAARVINVLAIKWFIAENVDLETAVGSPSDRTPIFHFLLDRGLKTMHTNYGHYLEYLRALQAVASAGAKLTCVSNSPFANRTETQIIKSLNLFMPSSEKLSNGRSHPAGNVEEDGSLREICDIVHVLIDMLSAPLSLKHFCRLQIRRSLGRDLPRKLHQLNIPIPLQEYIMIYKPVSSFTRDHSSHGGPQKKETELSDPVAAAVEGGSSSQYGSAEGPPRVVENRNLPSHPDDLRKEVYLIRMT